MGHRLRQLLFMLAWACALGSGLMMLLHEVSEMQSATGEIAMIAAFIPYGILGWTLAMVGFLVGARGWWRLAALGALVGLVVQLGWARPYWPHAPEQAAGPTLRVLSANVHYGKADPASAAAALTREDADVVILLEVSEPFLQAPEVAAALASLPHHLGVPAPGWAKAGYEDAGPTMVFSRTPLTEVAKVDSGFDQYVVRVDAHGTPLTLVAAHPLNMVTGGHVWEREGLLLREAIRPHLGEPLAVAGDLNAVPEHLTLRRLLDLGLTLGAQQAGAGWQPTFDGGIAGVPAMVPIDHVLVNDRVRATTYRTLPIAGSDHHAIVADLAVR